MRTVVVVLALFLVGCDQSTFAPVSELPYGTATITSYQVIQSPFLYSYSVQTGFDFSRGRTVSYSLPSIDTTCDMITSSYMHEPPITVTYLWSPGDTLYRRAFRFISQHSTPENAEAAFRSLLVGPDSGYDVDATLTGPNAIWIFQSTELKFAKILIRNISVVTGTGQHVSDTLYTRVTFDWVYQPNGTKSFVP
jgi:hypothetical protein